MNLTNPIPSNKIWGAGGPIHNPDFVNAIHNLWMPFTKCQKKFQIFVGKITLRKFFFSKSTYISILESSTMFSRSECLSEIFSKYFVNGIHKIVNGIHNCEWGRHTTGNLYTMKRLKHVFLWGWFYPYRSKSSLMLVISSSPTCVFIW